MDEDHALADFALWHLVGDDIARSVFLGFPNQHEVAWLVGGEHAGSPDHDVGDRPAQTDGRSIVNHPAATTSVAIQINTLRTAGPHFEVGSMPTLHGR